MSNAPRFDHYYRYDELSEVLTQLTSDNPTLATLSSIGTSFEGRQIWLVTLTDSSTGEPENKPALWVEANIHATEVTGATAALHLIHRLVSGFGKDEKITRVMQTRTFYVVPRLNPDGAELALADAPRFIRSSVRPYPKTDLQDGLHQEDIDGDGRILQMRIEDPNGPWKAHVDEPRLLVAREPDEEGGTYYRVFVEGTIVNFDGDRVLAAPPLQGLDLNRNWPADWKPEGEQSGAGPYPASEPEVRASVQAIVERPNVTGYITYHTFSAVHLRPYSGKSDENLPTNDLRTYQRIGKEAEAITGYPALSVFHDFKYDPKKFITGASDEWLYEHLGVFAWTTEFWSAMKQAGLKDYPYIEWFREHPVEDDLALLRWNDEVLGGQGFVDWYPFEHPQLGAVELGGWHDMYTFRNPPHSMLEKEIAPHSEFAIFHAAISPKLEFERIQVSQTSSDIYHLVAVVKNTGWLPTNVSDKAVERGIVDGVEVFLELDGSVALVSGELKVKGPQLTGRNTKSNLFWERGDFSTDLMRCEWVLRGAQGSELKVVAKHDRAGRVEGAVTLG